MNAIFLHLPDGTPTKWSMCSECHTVAAPGNFDLSEKCCTCYHCGNPLSKDEKIPYATAGGGRSLYHRTCEAMLRMKAAADALEKAELITNYDGPVYCEGRRGSYGDGYFANVDELAEDLDDEEDQSDRPEFAFCCESTSVSIDADQILENATEEMYDDAYDDLEGVEDFRKAVAAFNKANESVVSYYEDTKHKVAVPAAQKA
jgi:hypothetical protein